MLVLAAARTGWSDAATIVSLVTALGVGGLVSAIVNGLLSSREKVAEDLRTLRLRVYPGVWRRTSVLSRWPATDITYAGLQKLHLDLRAWYYETGGLYLSENARSRYGDFQELIGAYLRGAPDDAATAVPPSVYEDVAHVASMFRTALTEDLESRRRRSLAWTLHRYRLHRQQARDARGRLKAAIAKSPPSATGHPVRYGLATSDEILVPPAAGA